MHCIGGNTFGTYIQFIQLLLIGAVIGEQVMVLMILPWNYCQVTWFLLIYLLMSLILLLLLKINESFFSCIKLNFNIKKLKVNLVEIVEINKIFKFIQKPTECAYWTNLSKVNLGPVLCAFMLFFYCFYFSFWRWTLLFACNCST